MQSSAFHSMSKEPYHIEGKNPEDFVVTLDAKTSRHSLQSAKQRHGRKSTPRGSDWQTTHNSRLFIELSPDSEDFANGGGAVLLDEDSVDSATLDVDFSPDLRYRLRTASSALFSASSVIPRFFFEIVLELLSPASSPLSYSIDPGWKSRAPLMVRRCCDLVRGVSCSLPDKKMLIKDVSKKKSCNDSSGRQPETCQEEA
jgi:hypothetical protein